MSDKIYTLDEIKAIAAPIASRHGVAAMYLFGSYARGQATPPSDLNLRMKREMCAPFCSATLQLDLEEGFSKELDDTDYADAHTRFSK